MTWSGGLVNPSNIHEFIKFVRCKIIQAGIKCRKLRQMWKRYANMIRRKLNNLGNRKSAFDANYSFDVFPSYRSFALGF